MAMSGTLALKARLLIRDGIDDRKAPVEPNAVGGRLTPSVVGIDDGGKVLVGATARDRALAFYEREGFEVVGDGFVDATTQLPHHVVVSRL